MPTYYALVDAVPGNEHGVDHALRSNPRILAVARIKERNHDFIIKFEAAGFSLVDEFLQTHVRRVFGVSGVEIVLDLADHTQPVREAAAKLG